MMTMLASGALHHGVADLYEVPISVAAANQARAFVNTPDVSGSGNIRDYTRRHSGDKQKQCQGEIKEQVATHSGKKSWCNRSLRSLHRVVAADFNSSSDIAPHPIERKRRLEFEIILGGQIHSHLPKQRLKVGW